MTLRKRTRKIFIAVAMFLTLFVNGANAQERTTDYSKLINAIGQVESGMNDKAISGGHAGFLQISKICVEDCNRINKMKGKTTRYTLQDRFDHEKSIEMFYIIQEFYNKDNDIDYAILLWNEGCSAMKKPKRQTNYYNKVMKHYKEQ